MESQTNVKPTVLVVSTSRSFSAARLAMALVNAGCTVKAVCPTRHPLARTGAVSQVKTYHGLAPLVSLAGAITATKPDLVLPFDDLATMHLHDLYHRALRRGKAGESTSLLIERSLGAAASFPIVYARTTTMELAEEEGIRVPKSGVVRNADDLRKSIARMGLPIVLKANATSGGDGVSIVHTPEEAEHALRTLAAPPLLARAAKRAIIDRDMTLVWPSLLRRRHVVNAQAFVEGREATSAIACWKGTVLASLHFEVLKKQDAGGPSTVLRLIENPEMSAAAEKMARRLELSGLHGFDFMLEAQTGNPYLIEINPRATQVGHLTLGPGRDLPAALYAAVTGKAIQTAPRLTENDTIALFPQEWVRNPTSAFLRSSYHDVPWEEPELVRFCIRQRGNQPPRYLQQRWIEALFRVRRPRP
jgi:Carbamoyl-phosphate synthase L chain, ATP binding domain